MVVKSHVFFCSVLVFHFFLFFFSLQNLLLTISHRDICSRFNMGVKRTLHALRDCPVVKQTWNRLVPRHTEASFFEMNLHDRVSSNLKKHGLTYSQVPCSLLYGIAIWRIWSDHNLNVVGGKGHDKVLHISISRVALNFVKATIAVQRLHAFKRQRVVEHSDSWISPAPNEIKINVDSTIDFGNKVASVGIIARSAGGLSLGRCNIMVGFIAPLIVEPFAIKEGLQYALEKIVLIVLLNLTRLWL